MAMEGLVIAGYGTSRDAARERDLDPLCRAVESAWRAGHPDAGPCVRAYTSVRARELLAARGTPVPDVAGALERLLAAGACRATVAVTHLVEGASYRGVVHAVKDKSPLFDEVRLAAPLLASASDAHVLAAAIDRHVPRDAGAVVPVGHGCEGAGQLAYLALGYELHGIGRDDTAVGLLRGEPSFASVLDALGHMPRTSGAVVLAPLMLAAAGHVERDIAGAGPLSWRSRLEGAGYEVTVLGHGMGSWPEVGKLAVDHLRSARRVSVAGGGFPGAVEHAARKGERFPLFMSLAGSPCLVVGAGAVGSRRAEALCRFGADVTVIDPRPTHVRCAKTIARRYEPGDEQGFALVVSSTDERAVNCEVGARCRRLGIPVSVADASEECTFFFPALCEVDGLVAGITSCAAAAADHARVARAAARVRACLGEL